MGSVFPRLLNQQDIPIKFTMSRGKTEGAPKRMGKSKRAGLTLPVYRVLRSLRKGNYAPHIQVGSSIYMTAVMEYLVAEILELAGNAARDSKKSGLKHPKIRPRHLQLGIRNDEELANLFKGVWIAEGGVLPNIQAVLLPKKTADGHRVRKEAKSQSQEV